MSCAVLKTVDYVAVMKTLNFGRTQLQTFDCEVMLKVVVDM